MSVLSSLKGFFRRIGGFVRRGSMERRLDSEMQFHLDMLTERHVSAGLTRDAARRAALVEFGGAERFKDDTRDEYRGRLVDELAQDARYSLRVMRRNPGFAIAAASTFALGIGASAAIFSIVHGVLLEPLPYPDPNRLVVLWERNASLQLDHNVVSVRNFEAWRDRAKSYERIAGAVPFPGIVAGSPNPERVMGAEVSPGYFNLLGVSPALGRVFTMEEERNGGADVLVLSDGYWRSRFGADRNVVGKTLTIDGRVHTVIGVMPPSFDPPKFAWLTDQAFWRPFGGTASNRGWGRFLLVVGRLEPNVSLVAANRELEAIAAQLATEVKTNEGWSASVVRLSRQITGDVRLPLLVLLGAVGLLLLMAVTNVANLTLGLVRRREHELAVRRAIGATSSRLVRQLITQSTVLGAIGCAIGFGVAVFGVRVIAALLPNEMPRATSIGIDATVVAVMVAVSLVASVAVGAGAAARGGRDGATTLRERGGGRAAARLRGGSLVIAEIALGLVLTVIAGLTMRTFTALRSVSLGFDAEGVMVARVGLSGPRYQTPEARSQFFEQLMTRVRELPGVQAASAISTRPFGGMAPATTLGDASGPATGDSVMADVRYVDAQVFKTLRVPMLSGTTFDSRDRLDAPPRVVVSKAMARALWPNSNPIGKRLRLPMFNGISPEVIGVVGDMHLMDARTAVRPTVYLADTKIAVDARDIVVRGAVSAEGLVASLRAAVASIDPGVPVSQVTTLDGLVGRSLARDRFTALLLGAFAVVSLLLAGVGVYGVFAGDVAQRRKEIDIRVALGAPSGGVVRLVMRRAIVRASLGVALGTAAALVAANAMQSMLFGVKSTDPVSFGGVAVLLLLVAVAATLVPALRAARVSPLVAIRMD
jgi:putative ABC transport system permease protein